MNSWSNRAWGDPEQETSRLDSQNSDADKTILSSTEKSVAMKVRTSHTIQPMRCTENKSSSEYLPNFDTSSLHQFLLNQALWEVFMNSCMWATVQLSKDKDNLKRIFQNSDLQRIQTVFETVQAQISNPRLRDQEMYGLSEQVNWTDGHWRKYSLLEGRIAEQLKSKIFVFSDSVLCLAGKRPDHAARILEKDRITYFVERREYLQLLDLAGEPVEFVLRTYVRRTSIEIFEFVQEMFAEQGVQPSQFKGRILIISMYNDLNGWQNKNEHVFRQEGNTCCLVRQRCRTRTMVISRTWKTKRVRKLDRKTMETWNSTAESWRCNARKPNQNYLQRDGCPHSVVCPGDGSPHCHARTHLRAKTEACLRANLSIRLCSSSRHAATAAWLG